VELVAGAHPAGSVTVMNGPHSGGTRRLDADTCDDVADALALMVALALDPHALRAASPAPALLDAGAASTSTPDLNAAPASDSSRHVLSASAPGSLDSSVVDASAPDGSALDASLPDSSAASSPPLPPPILLEGPAPPDIVSRDAPPPPPPRHFFSGADFALATDVTPHPLFSVAPYVGYRSTRPALFGLFAPSVRLSFARAVTGAIAAGQGAADFTWTVGRLDGCAILSPDQALRIGACVRVEAGVLEVSGQQVFPVQTQRSAWLAPGVLARLEWSFFGPFFVDASGGSSFRIFLNRFVFLPDTSVYEVPPVGFFAEAGFGVHFL
jgi:hypothetical protein